MPLVALNTMMRPIRRIATSAVNLPDWTNFRGAPPGADGRDCLADFFSGWLRSPNAAPQLAHAAAPGKFSCPHNGQIFGFEFSLRCAPSRGDGTSSLLSPHSIFAPHELQNLSEGRTSFPHAVHTILGIIKAPVLGGWLNLLQILVHDTPKFF